MSGKASLRAEHCGTFRPLGVQILWHPFSQLLSNERLTLAIVERPTQAIEQSEDREEPLPVISASDYKDQLEVPQVAARLELVEQMLEARPNPADAHPR